MNALLIKELSGVARRWQTYVGRVVYVGLILLCLLPTLSRQDIRRLANPSEYANLGRMLFYLLVSLQMIFVPLMALSAASDMVSKEIRAGTLGLLALTPLTPRRIAMGKCKAAVLYSSSLFLCGVPALATCVFLGGVGVYELAWSTCLTGAATILAASLTILLSSILRAGYTATISGILILAGYTLIPGILAASMREEGMLRLLYWIHPAYAAVGAAMGDNRYGSDLGWVGATGVTLLLSWLLLGRAARVVARKILIVDRHGNTEAPGAESPMNGTPVWDSNAILWKEMRTRRSAGLRKAMWIGLIVLGIALLLLLLVSQRETIWAPAMLWLSTPFFLLMAMGCGVSLFVREKEGRQWEVLLSTPLSAWQIIVSKLTAGVFNMALLSGILFGFFTLVCLGYRIPFFGWIMTATSIGIVSAFAYVLGAAMSLRCASMRAAFSATFAITGILLAVLPAMLSVYAATSGWNWDQCKFPYLATTVTHPATYLVAISEAITSHTWNNERRYEKEFLDLVPYFGVHLAIYASGILGLIVLMRARFASITGRKDGH